MARCYIGPDSLKPKMSWNDIIERGKRNVIYVEACAKLLGKKMIPFQLKFVIN